MFSVNFECEDRHWSEIRNDLVNGFHLFAHYFHLRMKDVISGRPMTAEYDLSPREKEVLKWAADGKTAWETSQLLRRLRTRHPALHRKRHHQAQGQNQDASRGHRGQEPDPALNGQ